MFSTQSQTGVINLATFNLFPADALNLTESEILSFCKELNYICVSSANAFNLGNSKVLSGTELTLFCKIYVFHLPINIGKQQIFLMLDCPLISHIKDF